MSLVEVARLVGIDAGNLSRIERGIQVPALEIAERIAELFRPSLSEMQILYPSRFMKIHETKDEAQNAF